MKAVFLTILALGIIGFTGIAFAELDSSILGPFESNDLVLVGTVVDVNAFPSENKTQYNIKIEEYLKGKASFDMVTAILDEVIPADFPNDPLDYYNKPYLEKGNQVLVYLKKDGATYKMSPYSFTIKKPSVAGPPTIIHSTGPSDHFLSQGDEIVLSGKIKKGYLYGLEKANFDSRFILEILNEDGTSIESKKLDISPDGTYAFTFQDKDQLRIPGQYSWEISFWNGNMGGEFVVVADQKRWTPLKQFKSGVPVDEIQCNIGLELTIKINDFEKFYCISTDTKQILIERGWAFDDSKACRNPIDCFDSGISLDRTVYPNPHPEPEPTYTLTEVHCFPNQVIYNDECIYVLIPSDEFPKDMTKYFSMVDGKIINFCEIKNSTLQDRENTSGVTLDLCFEISHYKISDVNVIKFQSTTPPTWINIKLEDLTRNVELGSSPTFRVVETGWGNDCTSPTLEVYHMIQEIGNDYTSDDLIYKHRIVYPCPYYEPVYPPRDVLRIWHESDFSDFPTCEEKGRYLIVGDSGYERLALDYYYCGIENEN